jgi:DNA mismatch repair protein MutS2
MKLFPDSALVQLEFDKIKDLLKEHCRSEYARSKAENLRVHTELEFIELGLKQSHEFKLLMITGQHFPGDEVLNLSRDLKMLGIRGVVLNAGQFMEIRRLTENIRQIFRWFDPERRTAFASLAKVIAGIHYEKRIQEWIDEIFEENGTVRDKASATLSEIRMNLLRKRAELRKVFDRILSRLNKAGYVADIEESFLNGRRVIALFAEHKRQIKGILHGESDTRKTAFVEPEETISLNNEVFSLENDENREIYRIMRELTAKLYGFAGLLTDYHRVVGEFDFIQAKAKLAIDIDGNYPLMEDRSCLRLVQASHPLLYLHNRKTQKPTVPVNLELNERSRILVISGPNAGGKTVTLKTVGLLQLMVQSGLLVPVHPDSTMGIFKQIMIHIGDTQSIEFELSTYSSHLRNMKYFMENANGRTLFFIDELGSGSDPSLGGAFAEVTLEELVRKHAFGIVTTHYLNLKVMASKTPGIVNGAMGFDEKNLLPMYRLILGKPGSSYTFSIAERIGLDPKLIARARDLVDQGHFRLDKLLNRTEQDLRSLEQRERELQKLLKDNERLKKEMEVLMQKERHLQQVEILKHQNRVTEEKIAYLKEMERKLRQIIIDWRKTENKNEVIRQMQALLFKQKEKQSGEKIRKKLESKYKELGGEARIGDKVMMKKNHQVGILKELRGKNAIVQLGLVLITVALKDLTVVEDRPQQETASQ